MTITSSHTRKFIHAEKDESPVCRACYWKAWLRDQNRMLLGAPLGRRSRCRDAEEARAFANDYGYDLVSLLVPGMNCAPIVGRCLLQDTGSDHGGRSPEFLRGVSTESCLASFGVPVDDA